MTPRRPSAPRRRARPGAHAERDRRQANPSEGRYRPNRAEEPPLPLQSKRSRPRPEESGDAAVRQGKGGELTGSSRVIDAKDRFIRAIKPPPWQRTRRPLLIALVSLIVLASLCFGVLAYLPALQVAKTQVTGATYVSEGQLESLLNDEKDGPLAFVDTAAIEDQADSVPGVKSVEVSRKWPNTLAMRVTERTPVGVLTKGSQTDVVDIEGARLPLAQEDLSTGLPTLAVAQTASDQDGTEQAILEVLGSLPATVRTHVTSVSAAAPSSVTLTLTTEGVEKTVVWGGPEDSALKAEVVAALIGQPGSIIDVTSPHAPTVR